MGIRSFRINSMMSHEANAQANADLLLPRFNEISDELECAAKIKDIYISFGDFPLCIMGDSSLAHASELASGPSTETVSYIISNEKNEKEKFIWNKRKASSLKKKINSCEGCRYTDFCEGIWKSYLDIYGEEEFSAR